MVNTDNFNDMIADPGSVIYPLPAVSTLALLQSYGVTYPGNSIIPAPIESIRFTESGSTITQQDIIMNFLTDIYPKSRPNGFADFAISFTNLVTTDPNIQSAIYNFYTVTGNDVTDIIPDGTALPLNAGIIDLQRTYHQYALTFLMNLFTKHAADTIDNPHEDRITNLVNVWTDFFQTLYNQYLLISSNPVSLNAFILNKTTVFENIANLGNYNQSSTLLFIVPIDVIQALINNHNTATDSTVHPTLQSTLFAETLYPVSNMHITPEIFSFRGQYTVLGTGYYYLPISLTDAFPRMNASLFIQADVNITSSTTINILQLSSSLTTDTLSLVKLGSSTTSYQINLNIGGTSYTNTIPSTTGNVNFILVYTTTGIYISYLNDSNNIVMLVQSITNLTLDFDTIQIGVQVTYPTTTLLNTLQKFTAFPEIITPAQISLILQSILS